MIVRLFVFSFFAMDAQISKHNNIIDESLIFKNLLKELGKTEGCKKMCDKISTKKTIV